ARLERENPELRFKFEGDGRFKRAKVLECADILKNSQRTVKAFLKDLYIGGNIIFLGSLVVSDGISAANPEKFGTPRMATPEGRDLVATEILAGNIGGLPTSVLQAVDSVGNYGGVVGAA